MSMVNLIQQMQQSDFYPHKTTSPIEIIQTHISYIFLTGEYAYKLKKAVDFGFLNFTTLNNRKYFVEEELRLNKPIAPDIYLEILPIGKKNEYYLLGDNENIEDYVLKMRQFPQENLLINMFETGKLTDAHLQELGEKVAKFHQEALTNDYISSFGTIEVINQSIQDNYKVTEKYIGIAQNLAQYQETKQFTDNFLDDNKNLFFERIKQGKIRECHGDLHLKNICWWHNKIQLFDRIEFNESFRFVDTIYDVAFTVMDLDAKGKSDFANLFLNTYLEYTGDWEALQILPLYLCRQAYVRAKVTSFLLADSAISQTEKQQILETAKSYYYLAWKYTQIKQGKLILMSGLSGSGKTTIAKQIAPAQNGIHIRSDAVRKHLANIPLSQHGNQEIYTENWTEKTYNRLLTLGILLVKKGFNVILDATYNQQKWRLNVIKQAEINHIPLEIMYCHAPQEILGDRLSKRNNDISDATPEILLNQKFDPFNITEKKYVITINN